MDTNTYDDDAQQHFISDAERFAKALDSISTARKSVVEKRSDIFKLVDAYYKYASSRVQSFKSSANRGNPGRRVGRDEESSQDSMDLDEPDEAGFRSPPSSEQIKYAELEAQTWDLLRRLLPLRYQPRQPPQSQRKESSRFRTGAELWDEFLQSDGVAQERKAILECLQAKADDSGEDIDAMVRHLQHKAERGDIIAYGWLHTRSAIKYRKSQQGWVGILDPSSSDVTQFHLDTNESAPLVTQLDPDVVTRQNRKLQPQDEYFERAIWVGCYELLRRGRSTAEIRDWCVERTEVWRAVSMSALPISREDNDHLDFDPLSTLLWRRTSFALARQGGSDDYERAVYGILSGDIPSVEKVCKTWDDFAFAHYNALLRSQFDAYLMKALSPDATAAVTQSLTVFNAVQFHGDAASVGERLVKSLETNAKTSDEARTPLKSLQGAIVSNGIDQYLYELGIALGKSANQQEPSALIPDFANPNENLDLAKYVALGDQNGLRILAHVYLVMSALEDLSGDSADDLNRRRAQENVLTAYISLLRLNNLTELIPLYCSKLGGARSFFVLSRNLSRVTDMESRTTILRIMDKLGMNVAQFAEFQPRSLLQELSQKEQDLKPKERFSVFLNEPPTLKYGRHLKPDFFGDEPDALEPGDEQLIQSFQWMMLVDNLWTETFQIGTAIYKRFLMNCNLLAARAMTEHIHCCDIFKYKLGVVVDDNSDISWFDGFASGQLMSSVLEDDVALRQQYALEARNFFEMECLVKALDAIETVASLEGLAQDPTEAPAREFYTQLGNEVKAVKGYMPPLLNGWLLESNEADNDLALLRELYLPETILAYVSVLHWSGTVLTRDNLLECMELAAKIAEQDSDIASVMAKCGRMKELVEAFASASRALAINSKDKGSSKRIREMGWSRDLWSVKR